MGITFEYNTSKYESKEKQTNPNAKKNTKRNQTKEGHRDANKGICARN